LRLSRNIAIIVAVGLLLVLLAAGVALAYAPEYGNGSEYGNGWCWNRTNWGWDPPAVNAPDGPSPSTMAPGYCW